MEHCIRQTAIALRLADEVGLDEDQRVATYYTGLLDSVYCHADAHEQAAWFGDDIGLKADTYEADLESIAVAAPHAAKARGRRHRVRAVAPRRGVSVRRME